MLRLFWETMETSGSWRHTGGSGHLGQVHRSILSFATSCLVFWFFCCPWSEHGQQKETLLHHPLPELKCLGLNDTRLTSLKPLIKNNFPLLSYLFQDFSHSVERLTTALHIRQTTWTNKTCFSTDTTTRLHIILFPRAWIIVLLKAVDIGVYNEWGWKCCRALLCWQTTGRNVKV